MRAFTALLIAVVLTVILPIADEALVNAEAVLAVVAGGGAKQRVGRYEEKTERSPSRPASPMENSQNQECVLLRKQ